MPYRPHRKPNKNIRTAAQRNTQNWLAENVFRSGIIHNALTNAGLGMNRQSGLNTPVTNSFINALATITIAAANKHRIVSLKDVGSEVRGTSAGMADLIVKYDHYMLTSEYWSTLPFQVQQFFSIQENGESIVPTDSPTSNLFAGYNSALGSGAQDTVFGPLVDAQMAYVNGIPYWKCAVTLDLLGYVNKYVRDCKTKEINESSPSYLELLAGHAIIGQPQTVNVVLREESSHHLENFRLPGLL